MAKVSKVFISYRRDDAADLAGRIRDRMIQNWRLSKENVFMDIDNIKVGADFMQVIERTIRECQAMVILISPSWLTQVNTPGVSYVRLEAELAIRFRLKLIPILVGGAKLPGADQLPESLRSLTNLNIRPVRPDAFDFDLDAVRRSLGIGRGPGIPVFAAISALLLVAIGAGTLSQTPRGNPIYDLAHPQTAPSATQRTAAHVSLSFQTASIDTDSSASAQSPASVTVHCGNAGKLLGGGFSLEPNGQVASAEVLASYPSGDDSWTVAVSTPGYHLVGYAYCIQANFTISIRILKEVAGIQQACPAGGFATGAGMDNGGIFASFPLNNTTWAVEGDGDIVSSINMYLMCAVSGLSAGSIQMQSVSFSTGLASASCPTTQYMVGGGFRTTMEGKDGVPMVPGVTPMFSSAPADDLSGWQVTAQAVQETSNLTGLEAYAVCANIPQYAS